MMTEYVTGVMITVWNGGGLGYAATTDLSATPNDARRSRRRRDLSGGPARLT